MFQGSKRKTMKWGTLIKDIKEKVGLSQSPSASATAASSSSSSPSSARDHNAPSSTRWQDSSSSPARFNTPPFFPLSLSLSLSIWLLLSVDGNDYFNFMKWCVWSVLHWINYAGLWVWV